MKKNSRRFVFTNLHFKYTRSFVLCQYPKSSALLVAIPPIQYFRKILVL